MKVNVVQKICALILLLILTSCTAGITQLHKTVAYGNVNSISSQINNGADINLPDSAGRTPLHFAVYHRKHASAKYLIENGANLNAMDKNGQTPLFYAVHFAFQDMAKLLLSNGASLHHVDNRGNTPLTQAVCAYPPAGASYRNHIIEQLVEDGANVYDTGGGCRGRTVQDFASARRSMTVPFIQRGLRKRNEFLAAQEELKNIQTIEEYQQFLSQYPNTKLTAQADLKLKELLLIQKEHYAEALESNNIGDYEAFLAKYPDSQYQDPILTNMASIISEKPDKLEIYAGYVAKYPNFLELIPDQDKIYYIGPAGLSVLQITKLVGEGIADTIIASQITAAQSKYKTFSVEEIAALNGLGLSDTIIDSMMQSHALAEIREERLKLEELIKARASAPPPQVASIETQHAESMTNSMHTAIPQPITGNSGRYMCPYTQDGVLAEWTDMIISAKIGKTAGSVVGTAAGAYVGKEVGEQLLSNVPFGGLFGGIIGGAIGNKAGKKAGKKIGLAAAGGMKNVRKTSDLSFNSLGDLATYIHANHASHEHFQEAVDATNEVYPGFKKTFDRAVN